MNKAKKRAQSQPSTSQSSNLFDGPKQKKKGKSSAGISEEQSQRTTQTTQDSVPGCSQWSDNVGEPSSQANKLSPEQLEKLTGDTIKYILIQNFRKLPLKRQDITSNVMKDHGRCFNMVIKNVKEVFSMVYGFKLVEFDKRYFLVNETLYSLDPEKLSEKILAQETLLLIVLSYLFMIGRPVLEDHMYDFLEKAQLVTKDVNKKHSYFGDVRKQLRRDYVLMNYLIYKRCPDSNPPIYEFSIGVRAKEEVPYRKLLEFVSKVNGMDLHYHTAQLEEVKQQEQVLHTELTPTVDEDSR